MAQKIKVLTDIRYLKILRAPRFKKAFTTMARLPWDKTLGHDMGASAGQLEVWSKFTEIAHSTAGMPLHERLEVIKQEMSGFRAPNRLPPKPRAKTDEQIRSEIEKWRELEASKVRARV